MDFIKYNMQHLYLILDKMKNFLKALVSIFLITSLCVLSSCKEEDTLAPVANLLTSSTGVIVSLTWLTGSNAIQAPIDADLDLRLYDKNEINTADLPINWSENEDAFESITMASNLADGDYFLKVLMYENIAGKAITFTTTVTGGGKELKASDNFAATKMKSNGNYAGPETNLTVRSVMKITKSGNNYTIINQ